MALFHFFQALAALTLVSRLSADILPESVYPQRELEAKRFQIIDVTRPSLYPCPGHTIHA